MTEIPTTEKVIQILRLMLNEGPDRFTPDEHIALKMAISRMTADLIAEREEIFAEG